MLVTYYVVVHFDRDADGLFWPALFVIKGDAASAQEVAQLKGDMEAIEAMTPNPGSSSI